MIEDDLPGDDLLAAGRLFHEPASGYTDGMKFLRGFLMGAAVGFVAGTTLDDRRRRELTERASAVTRRQLRPVADTIGHEADRVAGAARSRVESAVARVGDAAVDAIDDDGSAAAG